MVALEELLKNKITLMINEILLIEDDEWKLLDTKIKLKYIHHLCSCIDNNDKNQNLLSIPLKSIKPKKLIQLCNFNKQNNKFLYNDFLSNILDFTFDFRKKYINIDKRKYYNYSTLPSTEYNDILDKYNFTVYSFLKKNINKINIMNLFTQFTDTNCDKILLANNNTFNKITIDYKNNIITLVFSKSIKIILTLCFHNDSITNNIPVKYQIKLINNI
jgi:hypothetical protein